MSTIGIVGFVLDTFGVLLIAYTTLMVHHRFTHEHKVDEKVFQAMKKEQRYGFVGMVLIAIGSAMELIVMLNIHV